MYMFRVRKIGRQFYMIEISAKFGIESVTPREEKRIKCEDRILTWTSGLSLANCVRMELGITIIHLNLNFEIDHRFIRAVQ